MDDKSELLQHFLAALAYRTQKALRDAPQSFYSFRAGPRHAVYALAVSGKREEARAVLEELKERSANRYVPAYNDLSLGERWDTNMRTQGVIRSH